MELINEFFGLHVDRLTVFQMIARAIVTFFVALALIRVSGLRTFGKRTAIDSLTALILGAIMGRGIVAADQPFFSAIAATLVIVLLHRLVAWLTFRSRMAGYIFKGEPILLMKDGKKQQKNLARTTITEDDILEALRRNTNLNSLDEIKEVYLERSGEISFVRKHDSK